MALPLTDNDTAPWVPLDTFGARLALIRQHLGLNVLDAANRCGVNDQSWRNWEAGKSPRGMDKVARKIADELRVDYTWLMVGGPLRSRCFAPFTLVSESGQMELPLGVVSPVLVGV